MMMMMMIREKEKERPLQYFSFQRRYRPSTVGITTEERKGFWSQNKSDQMWTASSAGMWTSKASQWCTMWTMWSSEHDGVHSVKKSDPPPFIRTSHQNYQSPARQQPLFICSPLAIIPSGTQLTLGLSRLCQFCAYFAPSMKICLIFLCTVCIVADMK